MLGTTFFMAFFVKSQNRTYLAMPQDGATVLLRHTGATVRVEKLLDAIRAGEGGGVEIAQSVAPRSTTSSSASPRPDGRC